MADYKELHSKISQNLTNYKHLPDLVNKEGVLMLLKAFEEKLAELASHYNNDYSNFEFQNKLLNLDASIRKVFTRLLVDPGMNPQNLNEVTSQELDFTPFLSSILEFMLDKGMRITPIPNIEIKIDVDAATDVFGPTAHYDPTNQTVCLYTLGRHPKDVLRSFCHEMIHHMQNMEGRLPAFSTSNTQQDSVLNEIEKEAHALGSMTFREWEDTVKNKFDVVKEETLLEQEDSLTNEIGDASAGVFPYNQSRIDAIVDTLKTKIDIQPDAKWQQHLLPFLRFESPNADYKVITTAQVNKPLVLPDFQADPVTIDLRVDFMVDESDEATNIGEQYKVMATMTQIIKELIAKISKLEGPRLESVKIFPKSDDESEAADVDSKRGKLYQAYVEKNLPQGWKVGTGKNAWGSYIALTPSLKESAESLNERRGKMNPFAKKLTSIAFELIKDAYENGSKVLDKLIYVGPDEEMDIKSDIEFDFRIFMERGPYNYTGGADNADLPDEDGDYPDPYLMVSATLPDDFTNWSELYMDLLDVVRHELEHLRQGGPNVRKDGWMKDDSHIRAAINVGLVPEKEYYKLEKEVDAMIQGLWLHAKKAKKPLIDVINRYLDAQGVEGEDRKEVLDAWSKRLPALGVSKDQRF